MKIIPTPQYTKYVCQTEGIAPNVRTRNIYADDGLKTSCEAGFSLLSEPRFCEKMRQN